MVSLVSYFKEHNIDYALSSSDGSPDAAFGSDNKFSAGSSNNFFWQISFSRPVTIDSYIISANSDWYSWSVKWWVSYSLDNKTFVHLPAYVMLDLRRNTDRFLLSKPVYCMHFRINGIENSSGNKWLTFNSFDCFGTVGSLNNNPKKLCEGNFAIFKQSILPKIIMLIYPSYLPK